MNHYFISYSHVTRSNIGFGACEVTLAEPIRSMDDIVVVGRIISEHSGVSNVVVLSFTRFDTDAEREVTR